MESARKGGRTWKGIREGKRRKGAGKKERGGHEGKGEGSVPVKHSIIHYVVGNKLASTQSVLFCEFHCKTRRSSLWFARERPRRSVEVEVHNDTRH